MRGLERPIYFTSCASSICKGEEENKTGNLHLLHRERILGSSKGVCSIHQCWKLQLPSSACISLDGKYLDPERFYTLIFGQTCIKDLFPDCEMGQQRTLAPSRECM